MLLAQPGISASTRLSHPEQPLGFITYVVAKAAAGRVAAIGGPVWLVGVLTLVKFILGE